MIKGPAVSLKWNHGSTVAIWLTEYRLLSLFCSKSWGKTQVPCTGSAGASTFSDLLQGALLSQEVRKAMETLPRPHCPHKVLTTWWEQDELNKM